MTGTPSALKALLALAVLSSLSLPLSQLIWHAAGVDAIAARELPPAADVQQATALNTAALTALAPFGAANIVQVAAAAQQDTLDLVLEGVITAADPSRSAAFILVAGETKRFVVDEAVAPEITLRAIASDHVRLEVEGIDRILGFPNSRPQAPDEHAADEPDSNPLTRLRNSIVANVPREKPDRSPPETIQDYIDLWRGRIRANPQQVLDAIGLVPTERGYTVSEGHDVGLSRVGLRAGDLITKVNGQAVGDMDRDGDLYDQIAASGLAQVEVERDGDVLSMSFPLR